MKIYELVKKFMCGGWQDGDLISLFPFLESSLKIEYIQNFNLILINVDPL
jgi:hypothetical protein